MTSNARHRTFTRNLLTTDCPGSKSLATVVPTPQSLAAIIPGSEPLLTTVSCHTLSPSVSVSCHTLSPGVSVSSLGQHISHRGSPAPQYWGGAQVQVWCCNLSSVQSHASCTVSGVMFDTGKN